MGATLTRLLAKEVVSDEALRARYGPLLDLVRGLIGVVPRCDAYLEIWPPGFRTYNVMVPNFLNLPLPVWGFGLPADLLGLALYVSSRAAECAYCSAHTCSFAVRRGARTDLVARALDADDPSRTAVERAVIAVARGMSRLPGRVSDAERAVLAHHLPPPHVEWLVMGVAMMGFLNKFMDAVGVELEEPTVDEVGALMAPSGWTIGKHGSHVARAGAAPPRPDTLGTKLGVLRYLPSALSFDRAWTQGVPGRAEEARAYLRGATGHDFPLLSRLTHSRAVRAIAVVIRDNLDAGSSVTGLPAKIRAGALYARAAEDESLARDLRALAAHHRVDLGEVGRDGAILSLARAVSPSPAEVDDTLIERCRELRPAAIVETVVWIGVLQMLHRIGVFYGDR